MLEIERLTAAAWWTLLVAVLLLGGIGVTHVVLPALRSDETLRRWFGTHRLMLASLFVAVVPTNALSLLLLRLLEVPPQSARGFLIIYLPLALALVGVTYLLGIRPGLLTLRDLGVSWNEVPRDLLHGLALGSVHMLVVMVVNTTLFFAFGVRQSQVEALAWASQARGIEAMAVFGLAAVVAPIAEELFFRGYVLRSYLARRRRRSSPWDCCSPSPLIASERCSPASWPTP
jgi:membrane protease YdiL (CAAX protease family)